MYFLDQGACFLQASLFCCGFGCIFLSYEKVPVQDFKVLLKGQA